MTTMHLSRKRSVAVRAAVMIAMSSGVLLSPATALANPVDPCDPICGDPVLLFPVVVTNTNDSGAGSLRAAIDTTNFYAGPDEIDFDLPGAGVQVISPLTDLPAITDPVTIDGYSQTGAAAATTNATAVMRVVIDAGALNQGLEVLADDSVVTGLVVRDADGDGIRIEGDRNVVSGNYVGVTANGETAAGNSGDGVVVEGDGNVVGGTTAAARNVISANSAGVVLAGYDNLVAANRIGTDDDGTTDLGNTNVGVKVQGESNQVGGFTAAARNLVSGNDQDGVWVEDAGTGNEVRGNRIGTNAAGTGPLGNGGAAFAHGVFVESADTVVAGNVIAANTGSGVYIKADSATVRNNMIGTNAAGNVALPNDLRGVFVDGSDNVIGGVGLGNVISGNGSYGVWIHEGVANPSVGNVVQGNLIGTDVNGSAPLGNADDGIRLDGADSQIGGRQPGEGNLVSSNADSGLHVTGDDNQVEGNLIGTDASGSAQLPNLDDGIDVYSDGNQIGENTVAFNTNDGIHVDSGVDNTLAGNSVFDNGDLGIDLDVDGVAVNDAADADAGGNDVVNYPVITAASTVTGVTGIDWELQDGLPTTEFRLEFFASIACDSIGGNGEGQNLLASTIATTDASGDASGHIDAVSKALSGQVVVATATVRNVGILGSTSEFSACQTVV